MTKLSTLILTVGLVCMATAQVHLTDPFVMNITLNQIMNKTSKTGVVTEYLQPSKLKLGVVASSATNQVRIDASYLAAKVNMVIDGTKGTFFAYVPMAQKCVAQSMPLTTFNISELISGFNSAGQASSFLVSSGAATTVPFNSKDVNSYYKYAINGITDVTGDIYIGLTALSFYFDVTINPAIIPAIPSIPIGSKNLTITIPTSFVASVKSSAVAPTIYANTFSVGGCTL